MKTVIQYILPISLGFNLFLILHLYCNPNIDNQNEILSAMISASGIFSAILITYIIQSIFYQKDIRNNHRDVAISLVNKIIDFRRILYELTVWNKQSWYDKETISKLDTKYSDLDFYEYRMHTVADYTSQQEKMIEKFNNDKKVDEGVGKTYLAMTSLVFIRRDVGHGKLPRIDRFLYHDFPVSILYKKSLLIKWHESEIFGTIWYWLINENVDCINFTTLIEKSKKRIVELSKRINSKYQTEDLNKLLGDIANDMETEYLPELLERMELLSKGLSRTHNVLLSSLLILVISGIIVPLLLLLIEPESSFNIVLLLVCFLSIYSIYFILLLKKILNKELID